MQHGSCCLPFMIHEVKYAYLLRDKALLTIADKTSFTSSAPAVLSRSVTTNVVRGRLCPSDSAVYTRRSLITH